MGKVEAAIAFCEIPVYLREHANVSLARRCREILASVTDSVTEADLIPILAVRPGLTDLWADYIADQRTSDGWYAVTEKSPDRPHQWIVARLGHKARLIFDSPAAAYAALVLRIVERSRMTGMPGSRR
jgi:hypothetical protein